MEKNHAVNSVSPLDGSSRSFALGRPLEVLSPGTAGTVRVAEASFSPVLQPHSPPQSPPQFTMKRLVPSGSPSVLPGMSHFSPRVITLQLSCPPSLEDLAYTRAAPTPELTPQQMTSMKILRGAHAEKYKERVIAQLLRMMHHFLECAQSPKNPSVKEAEEQLFQSQPGTYILRASKSTPDQIALCTHLGDNFFYHEHLTGSLEAIAAKLYERMTVSKKRMFLIHKKAFAAQFTFYLPYSLSYIWKGEK